jgi:AraC-like DNA-binding protein
MTPDVLLFQITCVSFFILAFIALVNPAGVNVVANRWLGLFFAAVGCMVLNAVIDLTGANDQYFRLVGFNELSRFAMAPALYLAIVQFTTPGRRFNKKDYLHFIPFAIFILFMVPLLYFPQYKLSINLPPQLNRVMGTLMYWSVKVQLLVYWILSFYKLTKHRRHIRLVISNIAPVSLNWLKYLLLTIGGMLLLFYSTAVFHVHLIPVVMPACYLAGSLAILYCALAQKEIFPYSKTELNAINEVIIEQDNARPIKQRLTDEQSQELKIRLEYLMATEKLYLDNELSLPQLAESMELSVHDLSYLLNERIGTNFYQFVNAYRIEEAKQIMLSDKYKHLNILGIAYNAGFNSKTTFNTMFKKQTGLSPSQFIQQAKTSSGTSVHYQS